MTALRPWLLAAWLAPLPAIAGSPPPIHADLYGELVRYRAQQGDVARGTPELLAEFLQDPASPYSDLEEQPRITNETWWESFAMSAGKGAAAPAVLDALRWQLGLTKAKPGIDVAVTDEAATLYRGREAAANAIKAGIAPDIFRKAWDLNSSHVTVAAHDAVALQLLREQMARVPQEQWPAHAIDPSVIGRYMRANHASDITDDDTEYMGLILSAAVQSGALSLDAHGTPQLPAAFRVARAAAALRDAAGYFSPAPYCVADAPREGLPMGPEAFAYHAPLCFVGATDRGVLTWFRFQSRLDESGARIHENSKDTFHRALLILSVLMPVMDFAAFVEFTEAAAAEEATAEAGADESVEDVATDPAIRRAERLACEVRAV